MDISKKFYGEILGGVFIAQLTEIKGEGWASVLNADSKTAPQLGISDALDVCFYSFGNTAVVLLRFCNAETGLTHDQNICIEANNQGVAGKHIYFNLAPDIHTKEFFEKLRDFTKDMPLVSLISLICTNLVPRAFWLVGIASSCLAPMVSELNSIKSLKADVLLMPISRRLQNSFAKKSPRYDVKTCL